MGVLTQDGDPIERPPERPPEDLPIRPVWRIHRGTRMEQRGQLVEVRALPAQSPPEVGSVVTVVCLRDAEPIVFARDPVDRLVGHVPDKDAGQIKEWSLAAERPCVGSVETKGPVGGSGTFLIRVHAA
jgi:hypothetical protein